LLIYPTVDDKARLVFIQRPTYDGAHSGQISLPGGRFEPADPSLEYTALRETYEEIGVPHDKVQVIGKLTDLFIPPSNFLVSPYVGVIAERPDFVIDRYEVEYVIEVDLEVFFNPSYCITKELQLRQGFSIKTPCYVVNGYTIWGATAMIIAEFVAFVGMEG
jgi:8-oxo-dGTP pyrophosphatase MutT (NUDIX family)